MSKRFPFTKRAIEALSPHDSDSKSREAEDSDAECIGLKLGAGKEGRKSREGENHKALGCG